MLFPPLGPISLPVVVAQPDKSYANKTDSMLEWYDRHRAYSMTSGSNEEPIEKTCRTNNRAEHVAFYQFVTFRNTIFRLPS